MNKGAYSRVSPTFRDGVHIYRQPPSGQSRVSRFTHLRYDGLHCRESAGTRPASNPQGTVVPFQVCFTMDQFLCTSLFPHPLLIEVCINSGHVCDTGSIGDTGMIQYCGAIPYHTISFHNSTALFKYRNIDLERVSLHRSRPPCTHKELRDVHVMGAAHAYGRDLVFGLSKRPPTVHACRWSGAGALQRVRVSRKALLKVYQMKNHIQT